MTEAVSSTTILQTLKDYFGYQHFRPLQEEIIQSVLKGKDVLTIMPTGGGKSICYQLPALLQKNITVVISPLIALMKDQVHALQQNGIKAYAIHSQMTDPEILSFQNDLEVDLVRLIYVSPERLLTASFLDILKGKNIDLFAVDEAHCISAWGNDFRPDYAQLAKLKKLYPQVPIIALTATADQATQEDIIDKLALQSPRVYLGSFARKNINIEFRQGQRRVQQILRFLQEVPGQSGIIYCLSRKGTEKLANKLEAEGYNATCYHAGMEATDRSFVQHQFIHDDVQIVCATIAFGMGIDKSNVQWVIHYNMPKNIESYYQEIGRAGRDGSPSKALLFYSYHDYVTFQKIIKENSSNEHFQKIQLAKLDRMWDLANTANCRTNTILNYFGELISENCGHCDNCIQPPETIDGTLFAQQALSALKRCREQCTIVQLIDILRGSHKQEIVDKGWHQIKTYGIGRHHSILHWKSYLTQMLNLGLISVDYRDGYKLKCTSLGEQVLYGERNIQLAEFNWKEKLKEKPVEKEPPPTNELFDRLRRLRLKLAKEKNIPAYTVFHNSVLHEMVRYQPMSKSEFEQLDGVGVHKTRQYADVFIEEIKEYLGRD